MFQRLSSLYRNLFRKDVVEGDLDKELHSCLEILTQEKIRQGMDSQEARRQARIELGGVEQIKGQVREVRAGALIQDLWQDLRYGARMLGRSPGFTLVAMLSLALVIGANSTIFSVLNPILFYSLPYDDADRLVVLSEIKIDQPNQQRAPTELTYSEWSRQARSFEQMARVTPYPQGPTISARGQAETGFYNRVSPTFFPLLGVEPQLGRIFTPAELSHQPGEPVLLSDSYWRRRFGADPNVLGEQMLIAGQVNIIVGVLPPGFRFRISLIPREPDVWQSANLAREPGAGRPRLARPPPFVRGSRGGPDLAFRSVAGLKARKAPGSAPIFRVLRIGPPRERRSWAIRRFRRQVSEGMTPAFAPKRSDPGRGGRSSALLCLFLTAKAIQQLDCSCFVVWRKVRVPFGHFDRLVAE